MSTLRSFVEKRYEVRNVRDGLQDDGFLIEKGKEQDEFVFYYINGIDEFKGECFYFNINDECYLKLLLVFCECISECYKLKSAIDCFNTFQNCYRFLLNSEGVLTVSSFEYEKYNMKTGIIVSLYNKAECIEYIDKKSFYINMFKNVSEKEILEDAEYNYLFVNFETNLFKIGFSKNPIYREKTLQSEEPKIFVVAFWKRDIRSEKELHNIYKEKRIRGEWFDLSLSDLRKLRDRIQK